MRILQLRALLVSLACGLGSATAAHAQWSRDPAAAAPIVRAPGPQYALVSASDGLGGAWFAFEDRASDPLTHVRIQHLDYRGYALFGDSGKVCCTLASRQLAPGIASDGAGGAFLTWVDFRADTAGDLYAQRFERTGAPAWNSAGVPLCAVPRMHVRGTTLAAGDSLDAYVLWQDDRAGGFIQDIYAQRVRRDGAMLWGAADGIPVAPVHVYQVYQRVVATDHGAVMLWADSRLPALMKVYAQRFDRQGHPAWTTNGVELCPYPSTQFQPVADVHPDGSFVAAWLDLRSNNGWAQVMAQRFDPAGAALGPDGGLPVSGAAHPAHTIALTPTASGGTIATWSYGDGGHLHVLGQRFDAALAAQWPANGLLLLDVLDGMSVESWAVADAHDDGLSLAAATGSYGAYDIIGEQYGADGVPRWPSGVVIRQGGSEIYRAQVQIVKSYADIIVAWGDNRGFGDWDADANLVNQAGVLAVPPPAPAAGAFFAAAAPSPVRSGAALALRFTLPRAGAVEVTLLDVAGRALRRARYAAPAGASVFTLAARDERGAALAPGVILVRASSAGVTAATRRVVVLR